jgi:hypothetical protein
MHYSYLHLGLQSEYILRGFPIKIRHLHNAKHPFYFNENLCIIRNTTRFTYKHMVKHADTKRGFKNCRRIAKYLTASQFKATTVFMPLVHMYKVLEVCCNGICLYFFGTNEVNHPYHGCIVKG